MRPSDHLESLLFFCALVLKLLLFSLRGVVNSEPACEPQRSVSGRPVFQLSLCLCVFYRVVSSLRSVGSLSHSHHSDRGAVLYGDRPCTPSHKHCAAAEPKGYAEHKGSAAAAAEGADIARGRRGGGGDQRAGRAFPDLRRRDLPLPPLPSGMAVEDRNVTGYLDMRTRMGWQRRWWCDTHPHTLIHTHTLTLTHHPVAATTPWCSVSSPPALAYTPASGGSRCAHPHPMNHTHTSALRAERAAFAAHTARRIR